MAGLGRGELFWPLRQNTAHVWSHSNIKGFTTAGGFYLDGVVAGSFFLYTMIAVTPGVKLKGNFISGRRPSEKYIFRHAWGCSRAFFAMRNDGNHVANSRSTAGRCSFGRSGG